MASLKREVIKLLKEVECYYVRPAKSDHKWWYCPVTQRHFSVDHGIASHHTANAILKQAGLPKAF